MNAMAAVLFGRMKHAWLEPVDRGTEGCRRCVPSPTGAQRVSKVTFRRSYIEEKSDASNTPGSPARPLVASKTARLKRAQTQAGFEPKSASNRSPTHVTFLDPKQKL